MGNKYKYIRPFEDLGLKLPASKGGGFLSGRHATQIDSLTDFLYGHNYGCIERIDKYNGEWCLPEMPENIMDRITVTDKDIAALKSWVRSRGANLSEDWLIKYFNAAKIGSYVDRRDKGIVTADNTPYITFEPWIKDGFHVERVAEQIDFDAENNKFFPIPQTEMQQNADRKKKEELEELLGHSL